MDFVIMWFAWGLVLLAQNFSFTFVSRARNSGSVNRHIIAALLSNGVWFASQVFLFKMLFDNLMGKNGTWMMVFTGVFYTAMTVLGSAYSHKLCLRLEHGSAAVGANDKYHQVTNDEWRTLQCMINSRTESEEAIDQILLELAENEVDV